MPEEQSDITRRWVVLVVEDDAEIREQIQQYFGDETFDGHGIEIHPYEDIRDAKTLIRDRKADILILDVFQGEQATTADKPGIDVLNEINRSGFVPVVFYTALPEQVRHLAGQFVRVINKTEGLTALKAQIQELFDLKVPQLTRKLYDHVDRALGRYMWDYAQERWTDIKSIADKPELMRIIMTRLSALEASPEEVHSAEYYIAPPVASGLRLGDVRFRELDSGKAYSVVAWPSCDLVENEAAQPSRKLKTSHVILLGAKEVKASPEYEVLANGGSDSKLKNLMKNKREHSSTQQIGDRERYHYLPGFWDIPHLVIDFQVINFVEVAEAKQWTCLATIASPFAEALSQRFLSYIGRLGTPDLRIADLIVALSPTPLD